MASSFDSSRSRVIPSEVAESSTSTCSMHRLVKIWAKQIVDKWFALQLAHYGGKYSIERMLALEEYTRNTSIYRVLLVIFGAPLVVIALVLCQESIPLQDPADGWEVNYGFWIRVGFVGVGVGYAASIQIGFWLDTPPLSLKQIMVYCVSMGAGYVAAGILVAKFWVFPIPFFMFTLSMVTTSTVLVCFRILVGADDFRQIFTRREQLRQLNRIGSLQAFMYVVYPVYQVLFTEANHTAYELPVLLVLAVFRLVVKAIFAAAAAYKEDMIPAQVVFTVDFFDAVYLVTFLQSVSLMNLGAIMVVDIVQTASELLQLHQQTRRIFSQLQNVSSITASTTTTTYGNPLAAIRSLCNSIDILHQSNRQRRIQVHSCINHELSNENKVLLERLDRCSTTGGLAGNLKQRSLKTYSPSILRETEAVVSATTRTWFRSCRFRSGIIQPVSQPPAQSNSPIKWNIIDQAGRKSSSKRQSEASKTIVLRKALELLFTSECLILSEYLEVFVPFVYGLFVLVMVNLPSAQYHTELVGVTRENVASIVSRMFTYASMEAASFALLVVITQRNCGINALYQLAFVLESQTRFVQSTLMMWILMTLTYRVTHFGTC